MPQLQVVDLGEDQSKRGGVLGFLDQLGSAYKENKDKDTFNSLLNQYQTNSEQEGAWEKLQVDLMRSDIAPTRRLELQGQLNQMQEGIIKNRKSFDDKLKAKANSEKANQAKLKELEKKQAEEAESYELLKDNGVPDDKAKELSKVIKPANAKTYGKPSSGKVDKFDQTLQGDSAKEYVKLQESIAKGKDALSNLDHLEDLSKNQLSGVKGYAKAALNTESAAEFDNLAFTSIEPIIKLFNPVGPIPVQKMKIIQQQFQMKAGDLQTTINGKIAALRRIGQQGLARNEARAALIKKYRGLVPEEELKKFDDESQQLQDALVDQEAFNLKMKETKKGEMVDGLYSSDGRKLKPMTKEKAEELYNKGLVTYVGK